MMWTEFEKALGALAEALSEPKTSIARDATIQRFEFCVELAWKTSRRCMGSLSSAPKTVVREMAQAGMIADPVAWFDFLEGRNLSSHSYKEEIAEKVYAMARDFLPEATRLLKQLKSF